MGAKETGPTGDHDPSQTVLVRRIATASQYASADGSRL